MAYQYYTYIDGQRYDSALISNARFRVRKQGDGRISEKDAQQLWRIATDGGRLTAIEEDTFRYLMANFNFTAPAKSWLEKELEKEREKIKSYYKIIDGLKYDRAILEKAEELTAGKGDGRISKEDATFLLPLFTDFGDIRIEEERTFQYLLDHYSWTPQAKDWFVSQFEPISDELVNVGHIDFIVKQIFSLTKLGIEFDMAELRQQTLWLRNKVEFPDALKSALRSFLESREHLTLGYYVMQIFALNAEGPNKEQEVETKIKELLENARIFLLPDESSIPEEDRIYDFPPNGESIEENWVFVLDIPALSDVVFYGIVQRDGQRTFNYGFN